MPSHNLYYNAKEQKMQQIAKMLKYVGNSDNKKVPSAAQMFSQVSVYFN